jgi:hypothetical protein
MARTAVRGRLSTWQVATVTFDLTGLTALG